MDILAKIQEVMNGNEDARISFVRGTLTKLGNMEAFNFGYSENSGKAFAKGAVKTTRSFEHNGETKEDNYFVVFVAFGDTAEAMAGLSEGDKLSLLTERRRRKFNDKWYEEDVVIGFTTD